MRAWYTTKQKTVLYMWGISNGETEKQKLIELSPQRLKNKYKILTNVTFG